MSQEFDEKKCLVCQEEKPEVLSTAGDWRHLNCPRCGEFRLSGSTAPTVKSLNTQQRIQLSGWIREQCRIGANTDITSVDIERLIYRPLPQIWEREENLLLEAESEIVNLGESFYPYSPNYKAASYSNSGEDLMYLIKMLAEEKMLNISARLNGYCSILPKGYVRLEELHGAKTDSLQGFVAMPFNDEMKSVYENGIKPAIFAAGYKPYRIDEHEHINKIDDEIVRQINKSKFIVADLTEHNKNVYFETGYALGKEIPIFWTCRESDMEELSFDIRQFNCIPWSDSEYLVEKLGIRIEAVLGKGPSNASADLS